jgi:hypothetical protein
VVYFSILLICSPSHIVEVLIAMTEEVLLTEGEVLLNVMAEEAPVSAVTEALVSVTTEEALVIVTTEALVIVMAEEAPPSTKTAIMASKEPEAIPDQLLAWSPMLLMVAQQGHQRSS